MHCIQGWVNRVISSRRPCSRNGECCATTDVSKADTFKWRSWGLLIPCMARCQWVAVVMLRLVSKDHDNGVKLPRRKFELRQHFQATEASSRIDNNCSEVTSLHSCASRKRTGASFQFAVPETAPRILVIQIMHWFPPDRDVKWTIEWVSPQLPSWDRENKRKEASEACCCSSHPRCESWKDLTGFRRVQVMLIWPFTANATVPLAGWGGRWKWCSLVWTNGRSIGSGARSNE